MESVKQMWESYSTSIFAGKMIGETQYTESRRCFYSGVFAMLCANRRVGEPDVKEDDGCAYMESVWNESLAFFVDVKNGRA